MGKKLQDGFECPSEGQVDSRGMLVDHPKFPHPEDCQKFYVCLNGVTPREQGCSDGTVYNEEQQRCDAPENVPGWYEFTHLLAIRFHDPLMRLHMTSGYFKIP